MAGNTNNEAVQGFTNSVLTSVESGVVGGVNRTVKEEKDKSLNGDFGWIKGFFLGLLEIIDNIFGSNLVGGIAGIPKDEEVEKLAQAAKGATASILQDTQISLADKGKFVEQVKGKILAELKTKKEKEFDFLSDENMEKVAGGVASNLADKLEPLIGGFKLEKDKQELNGKPLSERMVANIGDSAIYEAFEKISRNPDDKKSMAKLLGVKELKIEHFAELASGIPDLVIAENDNIKAKGSAAFSYMADKFAEKIKANSQTSLFSSLGMTITPEAISVIADKVADGIVEAPKTGDTYTAFQARIQKDMDALVRPELEQKIAEGIKDSTAFEVRNGLIGKSEHWYEDAGKGWAKNVTANMKSSLAVIDQYYENGELKNGKKLEDLTTAEQGRIKGAKDTLYKFAVDKTRSLNDAQRQLVGKYVAEVVLDFGCKNQLNDQNFPKLEEAIKNKLKENEGNISNLGIKVVDWGFNEENTIAKINKNNKKGEVDGDIISDIAKGFVDKLKKDPESVKGLNSLGAGSGEEQVCTPKVPCKPKSAGRGQ